MSLLLKELLEASTVWCGGWEMLSLIDISLADILFSATTSMESSRQSRMGWSTEPVCLVSSCPCLCSYLPSRPLHKMCEVMSSAPQRYLYFATISMSKPWMFTDVICGVFLFYWCLYSGGCIHTCNKVTDDPPISPGVSF